MNVYLLGLNVGRPFDPYQSEWYNSPDYAHWPLSNPPRVGRTPAVSSVKIKRLPYPQDPTKVLVGVVVNLLDKTTGDPGAGSVNATRVDTAETKRVHFLPFASTKPESKPPNLFSSPPSTSLRMKRLPWRPEPT